MAHVAIARYPDTDGSNAESIRTLAFSMILLVAALFPLLIYYIRN